MEMFGYSAICPWKQLIAPVNPGGLAFPPNPPRKPRNAQTPRRHFRDAAAASPLAAWAQPHPILKPLRRGGGAEERFHCQRPGDLNFRAVLRPSEASAEPRDGAAGLDRGCSARSVAPAGNLDTAWYRVGEELSMPIQEQ